MPELNQNAIIKVIGVGGGGCNAVNRMVTEGVQGVEFIVANTDMQVLKTSPAKNKIVLGERLSKGLGAGANPEIGRQAAIESEPEIKKQLEGANLIFVAAGMGGGTGTGAAPEIARIAKETGALVIAVVTKPFRFEGKVRSAYALQGVIELRKYIDSIIVISNDRLLEIIGSIPIEQAFKEADNILKQGVQTITDLINVPSLINLDFADVRTVMKNKGNALFGIGIGSGKDKPIEAANKAITSSLLETSIRGAKSAIVNVTGGPGLVLTDADDVVDIITQATGEQVNIVFGVAINKNLGDDLIVTIVATGFDENYQSEFLSEQSEQPGFNDDLQYTNQTIVEDNHYVTPSHNHHQQRGGYENDDLPNVYEQRVAFMQNRQANLNQSNINEQIQIEPTIDEMKRPSFLQNYNQLDDEDEMENVSPAKMQDPELVDPTLDDDGDFPTFLKRDWK